MKQLIVNADDFGRAPGVNRGVLDAHLKGIVTSTTIMINCLDAPAGLELAFADAPRLGVGLHFNLTFGRPVLPASEVPSLVDDSGIFYPIKAWVSVVEQFDPDEVRRELNAQVERFVSLAGRPPDHLDSHHHVTYLHPAALATKLDHARVYDIPVRRGWPDGAIALDIFRIMAPTIPEPTARRLSEEVESILAGEDPSRWPARFEMGFYDQRATLGELLLILTNLPENSLTEVMTHPGYLDEALSVSAYAAHREVEIAHLTHAATRECVQSEGLQLMSFGDLKRP